MNVLLGPRRRQEVTWQLEYLLSQTVTPEVTTPIHVAQQDLGGIVALAMVRGSSHTHTRWSSAAAAAAADLLLSSRRRSS